LIKLVSLSKGALLVGVAASAAVVSNAEFSNAPSHPSATASASASAASPNISVTSPTPTEKPATRTATTPTASPKREPRHGVIPQVVRDCVDKYLAIREQGDSASAADREAVGEVCKAAVVATGLSTADFWAKFGLDARAASGTTDPNTTGLEAQIRECVARYVAGTADASDACHDAISASGLTPQEFWTTFGPHANSATGELSADALAMVRECLTKYNAKSSDASTICKRAIELSGLTSAEFAAAFFPRTTETNPSATDAPKTTATTETYGLVKKCLELYAGAATSTDPGAVSDACAAAIKASGMSSTAFWAKFGKELATTKPWTRAEPTASPKPATNTAELSQLVARCLDLYKAVTSTGETKPASEACGAAIRASGLSSADFWAKFNPTTN
jgi:hypothetical protein